MIAFECMPFFHFDWSISTYPGIFLICCLSLNLAWQDLKTRHLDPGWATSLFLLSLHTAYHNELNHLVICVCLNLGQVLLLTISIVYLERVFNKSLLGGADLLYLLCISPLMSPDKFTLILPLATLLAFPQALYLFIRARHKANIALIPYLFFAVILLM